MMSFHPIKVIWNITNKCGYNCEICATNSNRNELNFDEKDKVLSSILSVGTQGIRELDFAGGDPLFVADATQIVYKAIKILGKEKISVTTTGKGIDMAIKMEENLSQLLYNCEVTIDCLDYLSNYLRNDISYMTTNLAAIKRVDKKIANLTINVPILDPEMDNRSIQKLVDEIAKIDVANIYVNLLRVMNVGRMNSQPCYCFRSPEHFVKTFIKYAENTPIKNVYIHCALRGKISGSQCNMLNDKIGIDCSGNVFACAWGGYIRGYDKDNICANPFYIGNLLENSLLGILTDKRATQLRQLIRENPSTHCRVYSFENNSPFSIFRDSDPLFECNSCL